MAAGKMLRRFCLDQSGAMFAEYALVLAIVSGGMACLLFYLGDAISDAMFRAADVVSREWELVRSGR